MIVLARPATAWKRRWNFGKKLTATRLEQHGLPRNYDEPFQIADDRPGAAVAGQGIFGQLGKIFPFMLVLWAWLAPCTLQSICVPGKRNAAPWKR
jgi:hypothetical protein